MNAGFKEQTIQTWQPYYQEPLTDQDAQEIITNWQSYLEVVSGWALRLNQQDSSS